ncbi:hypothetical protein L3Q82_026160 [Scortum barcoo]|uniref:Uncharacterized protein n=1 Tax=Scortum barcoo TaxID=214431 RepID=A0ACB8WHL8_9TELE|nr:hypothetical protein L3Q82_026160 [Scortum barcoo]
MSPAVIGFLLILFAYRAKSVTFQPSLPGIVGEKTRVEINCKHDNNGLTMMFWYQQTESGLMNLIGYNTIGSNPNYEKEFEVRFEIKRENMKTGALIINTCCVSQQELTGKVGSVAFEQSSPQVVNKGTEELRINCNHDDSSLQVMLWYQQKHSDRSISLIGFNVRLGDPSYEDQFKDRFQIKRNDTLKGSLIIRTLNPSDSAVYFCAASTQ